MTMGDMRLTIAEVPLMPDWLHRWEIQDRIGDAGDAESLGMFGDRDAFAARMQYMLNSLENEVGLTFDYKETDGFFGNIWLPIGSADPKLLEDMPEDEKIEAVDADFSNTFMTLYYESEPHPTAKDPDMEYLTKLAIVIDGENRYADLNAHRDVGVGFYAPIVADGLVDLLAADDSSIITGRGIDWLGPAHNSSASTIVMILLSGRYRELATTLFSARFGIQLSIRSSIKNSKITKLIEDYLSCEGEFEAENENGAETTRRLRKLVDGELNLLRI